MTNLPNAITGLLHLLSLVRDPLPHWLLYGWDLDIDLFPGLIEDATTHTPAIGITDKYQVANWHIAGAFASHSISHWVEGSRVAHAATTLQQHSNIADNTWLVNRQYGVSTHPVAQVPVVVQQCMAHNGQQATYQLCTLSQRMQVTHRATSSYENSNTHAIQHLATGGTAIVPVSAVINNPNTSIIQNVAAIRTLTNGGGNNIGEYSNKVSNNGQWWNTTGGSVEQSNYSIQEHVHHQQITNVEGAYYNRQGSRQIHLHINRPMIEQVHIHQAAGDRPEHEIRSRVEDILLDLLQQIEHI